MTYYIITDISEDYNNIINLANTYNISIQNIKNNNSTLLNDNKIIFDAISNDYESIKNFIQEYYNDEDHYNLIHKIII